MMTLLANAGGRGGLCWCAYYGKHQNKMASKKRTADGVIKKNPFVTVSVAEVEVDDADECLPEIRQFTAQIQMNGTKVG
jgi:hypothetical protein